MVYSKAFPVLFLTLLFFPNGLYALEINLLAGFEGIYDSNINMSPDNPEYDLSGRVMGGLALLEKKRKIEYGITARAYYDAYVKNTGLSTHTEDAEASVSAQLTDKLSVALADTFTRYQEARSYESLFGSTGERAMIYSNSFSASLRYDLLRRMYFTCNYGNSFQFTDSETYQTADTHEGGGRLTYAFSSMNMIYFSSGYSFSDYEEGMDVSVLALSAGYSHYFTRKLYMTADGGAERQKSGEANTSWNPAGSISLTDDLDAKNQLSARCEYSTSTTGQSDEAFTSWTASLSYRREVSQRMSVSQETFYGRGTYSVSKQTSELFGLTFAVFYAIGEDIAAGLQYSFTRNDSRIDNAGKYNRSLITISLSGTF